MSEAKAVTIEFIKLVAKGLGELNEKAVYVGGATVPLYLPPEMQAASRPTEDIDVVLEVIQVGSRETLEENLRKKGFKNDQTEGAPVCRWKYKGLTVDIMSPNEKVFGFTNKWFADGVKHAQKIKLDGVEIKILSLPYFLATKLEAFKDRGNGDFMASPDMEDIITILDSLRDDTWEKKFADLDSDISKYLGEALKKLAGSEAFRAAIPGAVFDRANIDARVVNIQAMIQRIIDHY